MSTEPIPTGAIRARAMRRTRARRLLLRLIVCVGLPTLLSILYYGFWASNQYQSVGTFTVESADGQVATGFELLIGSLPTSRAARDILVVRDYILSRDMLAHLRTEHGWDAHFQDPHLDWWSRLDADASSEDIYKDYLDRVQVLHDTQSNTLALHVRAYSAEKAQALAQAILAASEAMVNRLSDRVRHDRIRFAEVEVEKAERRFAEAREAVLALQGEGAELNPVESASALMGIRAELEGELAKARAEFEAARAVMQPSAPKVLELQQKVRSLAHQVEAQRRRLVDSKHKDGLNQQISRFEPLIIEKEFAQQALQSAITALELSRVEAARQHRYLVTIATPSLPSQATHPRRFWGVLTVFVISLLVTSIGGVLVAAVREHAKL
jgi:capsular polysaccharide transport system permease protein